jgi:hypothetical protein
MHGTLKVKFNQQMHTFQIKVLIQLLASSTCFEDHMFIVRKDICMCMQFCMLFFHAFYVSSPADEERTQ